MAEFDAKLPKSLSFLLLPAEVSLIALIAATVQINHLEFHDIIDSMNSEM